MPVEKATGADRPEKSSEMQQVLAGKLHHWLPSDQMQLAGGVDKEPALPRTRAICWPPSINRLSACGQPIPHGNTTQPGQLNWIGL